MNQPYDNTNRGGIWKNDRKETDTHPDFTGNLNVDGVEYWINGWKRKQDANPKSAALSLSIKRKEDRPQGGTTEQQRAAEGQGKSGFEDDGDIPF